MNNMKPAFTVTGIATHYIDDDGQFIVLPADGNIAVNVTDASGNVLYTYSPTTGWTLMADMRDESKRADGLH